MTPSIAQIDKKLKSLGCELWPGEAFYLTDPVSRGQAAQWIQDLIRELSR